MVTFPMTLRTRNLVSRFHFWSRISQKRCILGRMFL